MSASASRSSGESVVITEGPTTGKARLYQWLLDHLAKFPGRVTAVTFAAGAAVTIAVALADGDWGVASLVSLVATLWALFFAVMIYLLTARDTDKVLDQIADLHEQLATALAAPEEEGGEEAGEPSEEAPPAAEAAPPAEPAPAEPVPTREPAPAEPAPAREPVPTGAPPSQRHPSPTPGRQERTPLGHHRPRLLTGAAAIAADVPADLLAAWTAATGRSRDELSRAWTRDPSGDRQWVLEAPTNERWVVFSRGDRGTGVIPLDGRTRDRTRRPGR